MHIVSLALYVETIDFSQLIKFSTDKAGKHTFTTYYLILMLQSREYYY